MRSQLSGWTSLALLAATAGCAADEPEVDVQLGVTDSAGIRIVVSRADPSNLERWTLSPRPDLVVGTVTGPVEQLLNEVRTAVRLPDGSIAIGDGSNQVRLFSRDGTFIRTIGRRGAGPGEFRGLVSLRAIGSDTLVAFDAWSDRVSYLSHDGELLRDLTLPIDEYGIRTSVFGPFADGAFIAGDWQRTDDGVDEGPVRDSTMLLHIPNSAAEVDTLGWTPAVERYRVVTYEGGPRAVFNASPPYWREAYFAAGPRHLFFGHNDRFDIRVINSAGTQVLSIRLAGQDRAVDPRELERLREAYPGTGLEGWAELRERAASNAEYPETRPAHGELFADREGNLWVSNYTPPGYAADITWRIFGPDGAPKAIVETPAGADLLDAGGDYVLALERDDLGVEYVKLYSLTRDPS